MPILDQLRRGVDTARSKTDQMIRIRRVQGEITSIRQEIQTVREKIADGVIELHQKGTLTDPELENLCVEIGELNAQISEKEEQIASIRAETSSQASST